MAKALPPTDDAQPKKKSRFKMIMLLCSLVLLLSALGGGGYWWLYMRPGSEGLAGLFGSSEETVQTDAAAAGQQTAASGAEGQPAGEKSATSVEHGSGSATPGDKPKPRAAIKPVPLPALTVNLADPSGQRYLNIGMDVELNSPEAVAELEGQTARIRDAIILLLSSKKVADLATAEGKILLKTEVAARLNQILGAQRVVRIYFTEFVMR